MKLPRKGLIGFKVIAALMFICLLGACLPSTPPVGSINAIAETVTPTPAGQLMVHFIDVGQGDSILIQAPGGYSILIDGGEAGSGALEYLRRQKISKLDLIILTHPDSDHLGGIVEILKTLPVMKIVTNGQPHTTTLYENFLDAVAKGTAEYSEVKRGENLKYGELVLNFLNPLSIKDDNLNNNSLVFRIEYRTVSFMFTGDAQADGEAQLLSSKLPLSSTILKVAHHGSKSSSTPAFLQAVHPAVAVYTAGLGNPSGNPSPDTLANLAAVGAKIYGTDQNGTIIVSTDGIDYLVQTEKQPTKSGPTIPIVPNMTDTPVPTLTKTAIPTLANTLIPTLTKTDIPTITNTVIATLANTLTPTLANTLIPTPTHTKAPTSTQPPALSLKITSLTSPIIPGAIASLTAQTNPGASCTITVMLKNGKSEAAGLGPQTAGADGKCTWSWKIGSNTSVGIWRVIVQASLNGQSVSKELPFEVKK
jgi:competence protein ComEC